MPARDIRSLDLWPHQRAGVDACNRYLASGATRSALVQMPTGTGKTGVMATISAIHTTSKPVLVVCPSIALVQQLIDDFSGLFWKKIGADNAWAPEKTLHLLPSVLDDTIKAMDSARGDRVVVLATIQTLQQIHSGPHYGRFAGRFGTVLFDEGHREPATLWAKAVRGLGAPTILFSATPFRNDLKIFEVDEQYVHFLSFEQAVADRLIRGVDIVEETLDGGATEFARRAIVVRDHLIASGRYDSGSKMIVRAASEDDVETLFAAFISELGSRSEGVLALHHNYSLDGAPGRQRRPDVPRDLRTRTERFLIHQFMLSEGIDDPACTMLALYDPFSTERQLVQQVGRITRHGGQVGMPVEPAFVLARRGNEVSKMWNRFLCFDRACVANNGKPPIRNDAGVLEGLIAALPRMDYISGKFRARLDIQDVDLEEELRIPKSAVVFDLDKNFDLDEFQTEVSEELKEEDRFERRLGSIADGNCRYHLTLRLRQSPFLADSLFLSPSLELTIYAKRRDKLFFYDSAGLWIENSDARGRMKAGPLRSLIPEDTETRVTSLTMKNTDLGPVAIKSRSIDARSLAESGVFMGEHLHVVTRAAGRVGKSRRAVAFARARVRDGEGARWTPNEFYNWTEEVEKQLRSKAACAALFERFATPSPTPAATDPKNILIDVNDLRDEFVNDKQETAEFDLDHVCTDVANDPRGPKDFPYRFDVFVNGSAVPVWIKWDRKKQKYWLRSDGLSAFKLKENPRISLTRRLNQKQPFRIVVAGSLLVYAFGGFYAVDLDLRRRGGAGTMLLNLTRGISGLDAITSEKGALTVAARTWPRHSLFHFIDQALQPGSRSKPFGEPFPTLVCDDLGTEVADFIGADDGTASAMPRATFIAAKWKDGDPGVSASLIYDVCGQVGKNLAYLKPDARDLPGAPAKWNGEWKLAGGRVPRIRAGTNAAAARSVLRQVRADPNAQRSFWMVLAGGILSRAALEQALSGGMPHAHVLQFAHLVLSVHSACQSVGADLRIYCAE
ncbi:DEAD/DEAH box helicase family protein [Xanthobacteraceae bacterium Astr-EGSB]|uniref:DEAD/DEAH box helicase n=1 Tax=Astrobacterium formosum TaxID=3069710 RepID=UPI0027B86F70|nr:DEAD/DEAH box helicase family protein [Xanthobacteraceae bacterium Astr-EGSB]